MPRHSTVPAMRLITISALPLRLHKVSDGGQTIRSDVAIQLMRRLKSRVSSQKLRHANAAKQASVTALRATTATTLAAVDGIQ